MDTRDKTLETFHLVPGHITSAEVFFFFFSQDTHYSRTSDYFNIEQNSFLNWKVYYFLKILSWLFMAVQNSLILLINPTNYCNAQQWNVLFSKLISNPDGCISNSAEREEQWGISVSFSPKAEDTQKLICHKDAGFNSKHQISPTESRNPPRDYGPSQPHFNLAPTLAPALCSSTILNIYWFNTVLLQRQGQIKIWIPSFFLSTYIDWFSWNINICSSIEQNSNYNKKEEKEQHL